MISSQNNSITSGNAVPLCIQNCQCDMDESFISGVCRNAQRQDLIPSWAKIYFIYIFFLYLLAKKTQ